MSNSLLQAGALLPVEEGKDGALGDPVSARAYRHPALGERAVVKLVADNLAPAEDLSLEYLGFSLQDVRGPVGRGRRQALGFPAWALINDPKNGGYALAVVKEMERIARVARSKPGNAKEQYEAIAARLARSVPQFLPTFFEQAGRTFIDAGNNSQAATMFTKAREAERVYNLQVDEARRRDVYLEFALTGAMSAGALEDHASELSRVHSPAEAYELFREVCIQRTRGGLPPWGAMAEQLRSMAAKAGLDRETEDAKVLEQLLEAPATAGAALGFWKAYEKSLTSMARKSAAVRGRLLNLHPWPPREGGAFTDWWLALLERSGATEALWAPAGQQPAESEPAGGPAAWLSKVCAGHNKHDWGRGSVDGLMNLLPTMAPRLKADGEPVDLHGQHAFSTSLDLIDVAIELGVPIAAPERANLGLDRWLAGKRRRQLTYLAADPAYGPMLMQAVDQYLRRNHADTLIDTPGLSQLVTRWLDTCADRFEKGGLLQLEQQLGEVDSFTSPRTFALNPKARERIASASAAGALHRTLRGGLMDELGWPALEQARSKLAPKVKQGVSISESWPFLIVSDSAKAFVVSRDRIVLEHDVRITGHTWGGPSFLYTGGQLLVTWNSRDGPRAYWSGRPAEVFDPQQTLHVFYASWLGASYELEDGGRTMGGRAVHAGDTKVPARTHFATDGKTFWRAVGQPRPRFEEFDPATGRTTGSGGPAFFEDFRKEGYELELFRCWMVPFAGDGALGPAGLGGMRTRRHSASRRIEMEMTDGLSSFSGSLDRGGLASGQESIPAALVKFPGDSAPRPLSASWQNVTLFDPSGQAVLLMAPAGTHGPPLAPSTPLVPPALFWQHLQPRDPAGSAALRAITEAAVRQLLESAVRETASGLPATTHLLKKVLPQVKSPELVKGVIAAVAMAAKIEKDLRALQAVRGSVAAVPVDARPVATVDDATLASALSGLLPGGGWYGGRSSAGAFAQIKTVADYIGSAINDSVAGAVVGALRGGTPGTPMPKTLPTTQIRWNVLAGRMAALALRAASPGITPEQREALLSFLELWADTVFARHPEWFRVCVAGQDGGDATSGAWLSTREWHHYFYAYTSYDRVNKRRLATVIEGAKQGFKTLNAHYLVSERPMTGPWETRDRILELVQAVRTRGPVPWKPSQVERLCLHTGMTTPEATLILAGLPNLASYQHNFLEKAQREAIGLKSTEASAGREALKEIPDDWRLYLLAAAMPPTVAELWDPSDRVGDRVAGAWLLGFKKREPVDDQLIVAIGEELKGRLAPAKALELVSRPAEAAALNHDGTWAVKAGTPNFERVGAGPDVFDMSTLMALARLVPWLFLMQPVGDPVRQSIPEVISRARLRLKNPNLVVGGNYISAEVQGRSLKDLLPKGSSPFVLLDAYAGKFVSAHLRPSAITGGEDPRIVALVGAKSAYAAARLLAGPAGDEFVGRVRQTPVRGGGFEANPAASAPELVAEARNTLQLTEDAAVLYLQLLTLAEPTVKNVVRWNAWEGKQFKKAADELIAKELAVSGKRPRAAREIFLPGPWSALKAPNLPVETWKMPLYGDAPIDGRMLILRPVHLLFAEAWRRLQSGDRPRFEEVTTESRAK